MPVLLMLATAIAETSTAALWNERILPRPTTRYELTSPARSASRLRLCLNVSCVLWVKGTNRVLLDGAISSGTRVAASNRTIKISASIATTLR